MEEEEGEGGPSSSEPGRRRWRRFYVTSNFSLSTARANRLHLLQYIYLISVFFSQLYFLATTCAQKRQVFLVVLLGTISVGILYLCLVLVKFLFKGKKKKRPCDSCKGMHAAVQIGKDIIRKYAKCNI